MSSKRKIPRSMCRENECAREYHQRQRCCNQNFRSPEQNKYRKLQKIQPDSAYPYRMADFRFMTDGLEKTYLSETSNSSLSVHKEFKPSQEHDIDCKLKRTPYWLETSDSNTPHQVSSYFLPGNENYLSEKRQNLYFECDKPQDFVPDRSVSSLDLRTRKQYSKSRMPVETHSQEFIKDNKTPTQALIQASLNPSASKITFSIDKKSGTFFSNPDSHKNSNTKIHHSPLSSHYSPTYPPRKITASEYSGSDISQNHTAGISQFSGISPLHRSPIGTHNKKHNSTKTRRHRTSHKSSRSSGLSGIYREGQSSRVSPGSRRTQNFGDPSTNSMAYMNAETYTNSLPNRTGTMASSGVSGFQSQTRTPTYTSKSRYTTDPSTHFTDGLEKNYLSGFESGDQESQERRPTYTSRSRHMTDPSVQFTEQPASVWNYGYGTSSSKLETSSRGGGKDTRSISQPLSNTYKSNPQSEHFSNTYKSNPQSEHFSNTYKSNPQSEPLYINDFGYEPNFTDKRTGSSFLYMNDELQSCRKGRVTTGETLVNNSSLYIPGLFVLGIAVGVLMCCFGESIKRDIQQYLASFC